MEDIKFVTDAELEASFSDDSLKLYMREIKRYPILDGHEIVRLYKQYMEGDLSAKEKIINSNLRLVVSVAYRYQNYLKNLQILDLIQEGNLGLIRALDTWNPELGAFTTYAVPWIRQKITRGMSNTDEAIRKPVHMDNLLRKYKALLNQYPGQNLEDDFIMDRLDIGVDTLKTLKETIMQSTVSMNQKVGDEEDTELGDLLGGSTDGGYDEVIKKIVTHDLFAICYHVLNPREYYVLYERVLSGEENTLEVVGEKLNITRERVRQIEAKALRKIKPYMEPRSSMKSRLLTKLHEQYGRKYDSMKFLPKDVDDILFYMYVREELYGLENHIYHEMLFGEQQYNRNYVASKYGITVPVLKEYEQIILGKVAYKKKDKRKYKMFRFDMIRRYGSNIFNVNLIDGLDKIDYVSVKDRYINLSFEELKGIFGSIFDELTRNEKELLERYYVIPVRNWYGNSRVEKEVNLVKYGFKKPKLFANKAQLYKTYMNNLRYFNDEQRLYLECCFFKNDKKTFREKYPNSNLIKQDIYLIERLEKIHYRVFKMNDNTFTKEKYLEVKEKYGQKLGEQRIKLLDLFYGVDGPEVKIADMAAMFNMEYIYIHDRVRDAREFAISLYYNRTNTIDIDKKIYKKYVFGEDYNFTDETRYIMDLFINQDKSYDEIDEITKLGKYRISNIITEAIRKMDMYRYGIIGEVRLDLEEFKTYMNECRSSYTNTDIAILYDRYFGGLNSDMLSEKYKMIKKDVNTCVARFNRLFYKYRVDNVLVDVTDIFREVDKHISVSILEKGEKEFLRDMYGIGKESLSEEDLLKKYKFNKLKDLEKYHDKLIDIIAGIKLGIVKHDYEVIERNKLEEILQDIHLPISDKEKHIICSLFEICGYEYKSAQELAEYYGERKANIKRRYQRGILNIFKYLNGEIEGVIDFENDVAPNLKYFSKSDQMYLTEYYKNGLTYEDVSRKYNLTFNNVVLIYNRIINNLKDILKGDTDFRLFDFDYYEQVFMNEDVPYYGDKELAKKIFDMFYGNSSMYRYSLPKITEELRLEYSESTLIKLIDEVLLSVCKYRDGIRKKFDFSYEEVCEYYERNKDTLGWRQREYDSFFRRFGNRNKLNGKFYFVNNSIVYDLIQDKYPDYFRLSSCTKEEAIELLKRYNHIMLNSVRLELMAIYEISERHYMSGKEINHVYRILHNMDMKKKAMGVDKAFVYEKPSYES